MASLEVNYDQSTEDEREFGPGLKLVLNDMKVMPNSEQPQPEL
jgi:hypothetical protein